MFFNGKKKEEEEIYYFPKERIPGLYERLDSFLKTKTRKAKFDLWKYIEECFPQIDMKEKWAIKTSSDILHPYLKREKND